MAYYSFYVKVLDIPCEQGIIKKRTFALRDTVCDPSLTISADDSNLYLGLKLSLELQTGI